MKKILGLVVAAVLCTAGTISARLPEPASMPQDIKGASPHKPEVAVYYLTELVKEGKMTAEEAERTEVYMISGMPAVCRICRVWKGFPRKTAGHI